MLNDDELAALIEVGVESRGIEFKGPGSTSSSAFVAVVARACIALANQRDGGHLVIGVVDKDPGGERGGLDATQLTEWLSYDTVVAKVNAYADPPLQLQLAERHLPSGPSVVVIEVAEFAEIPILSAKEFSGKIVRGQLYTRSMAKPESSASNTQNELREVLAIAAEKQLQAFLRTARHAGLAVEAIGQNDIDQFMAERAAFLQESIASGVSGLPQISVAIRPEVYQADRLSYEGLPGLVGSNAVRFRGWPFPFVQSVVFGDRWVGEAQTSMHPEAWGIYQSGQFVDIRPFPNGYGPDWDGHADTESEGPYLPVWFPVMFILEAMAFAARLQKATTSTEPLVVKFAVEGAQGWELVVADPRRSGFHGSYRMGGHRWERRIVLAPDFIEDDIKNAAAEVSRDLLLRFGWTGVTTDLIRGMQDEVLGS
ncbi:helix-turn-helix domain-containing protein [Paenarthrobacter nicotinovorans]|uniref:AlbA family DNA-binding domain-containing protein n=1 Tax=Paenarthrobacter nicotinovorans TaxID=29320 RepID=UPI00380CF333